MMRTTKISSPIPWIGGKHALAKWIISHFPEHHCYVEVFGGGASVLLQKPPSKVEVYNDKYVEVVNFFLILRDKPWQLVAAIKWLPNSRFLYEKWLNEWRSGEAPKDPVLRAAVWFYLQRYSFSGNFGGGWSHGKTKSPPNWNNIIENLILVAERLQKVQIECRDFREIIETYDSPNTLFYCDPPYIEKESYYQVSFTMKDHKDLAKLLNNISGKACVSYYPHPFINEHYKGWHYCIKQTYAYSTGITRFNRAIKRGKRIELLLMNYDPPNNECCMAVKSRHKPDSAPPDADQTCSRNLTANITILLITIKTYDTLHCFHFLFAFWSVKS